MKLGHLEMFVEDSRRALEFYTTVLGFTLEETQGEQFVWLTNNGLTLLLRPGRPRESAAHYRDASIALVLYTENLEASRQALERKGVVIEGSDGSPGCLTFRDPFGNWLQLVNPASH